jgi:uncharacterized protein YndB with AHSA1/START domain
MMKPEWIRRWMYAPQGWTISVCEGDVRVGGRYCWAYNGPDGKPAMKISGVYREVVPPERVVHTETMEMGCGGPLGELIATLELAEQGEKTMARMTLEFPSKQDRDGALASGMEQGVAAGYDKLDKLLEAETSGVR